MTTLMLEHQASQLVAQFREAGYACFPLIPNGKKPAVKEWQNCQVDTYSDADFPGNYGVNLPSNIMVIDSDPRNYPVVEDKDGQLIKQDTFAKLEAAIGPLPSTLTVLTGGGGHHRYFVLPGDVPVSPDVAGYPGLDFLSAGHFVVGPGSVVVGKPYTIISGHHGQLADAPEALVELIRKDNAFSLSGSHDTLPPDKVDHQSSIRVYTEHLKGCKKAVEGDRGDETTFKTTCMGRDYGLTEAVVFALMWEHYNPRCQPEWSEPELAQKIKNAFKYAKGDAGNRVPTKLFNWGDASADDKPLTFPLEALPRTLAETVCSLQRLTKTSTALAAMPFLSAMALVVQGHANIQLPTNDIKPISLFMIAFGESGERKSAVFNRSFKAVFDWEVAQQPEYQHELAAYKFQEEVWKGNRQIAIKANLDGSGSIDSMEPEPDIPIRPNKIFQEPTFEAVAKALPHNDPSIGIVLDEGGGFIGGHAMKAENQLRMLTGLSTLWDGNPIKRDRAGDGHTVIAGVRLSILLMVQPVVAEELFMRGLAKGQGFLARCCVAWPESTMGSRPFTLPDPVDEAAMAAFNRQIMQWLLKDQPICDGTRNQLNPKTITLNVQARQVYIDFHDKIEAALGPNGRYRPVSGEAAKAAEIAARIATVIAMFENTDLVELNANQMACGVALAQYFLDQALYIHQRFQRKPPQDPNLTVLSDWLTKRWTEPYITPSDVQRYCSVGAIKKLPTTEIKILLESLVTSGLLAKHNEAVDIKGQNRTKNVYRLVGLAHHTV